MRLVITRQSIRELSVFSCVTGHHQGIHQRAFSFPMCNGSSPGNSSQSFLFTVVFRVSTRKSTRERSLHSCFTGHHQGIRHRAFFSQLFYGSSPGNSSQSFLFTVVLRVITRESITERSLHSCFTGYHQGIHQRAFSSQLFYGSSPGNSPESVLFTVVLRVITRESTRKRSVHSCFTGLHQGIHHRAISSQLFYGSSPGNPPESVLFTAVLRVITRESIRELSLHSCVTGHHQGIHHKAFSSQLCNGSSPGNPSESFLFSVV